MNILRRRPALWAMYVGAALTVGATIAPYIDQATGNRLADHVRDGYPTYTSGQIDSAVTAYLAILTTVGVLGIVSWAWTIWAVSARKRWARFAVSAMFAIGVCVALTGLLVKDTSGDTGLAPLLGWIGMLPCVAGAAAAVLVWRRPSFVTADRP